MSKILDSIKLPKKATKLVEQPEAIVEAAPVATPEPVQLVLPEENPIIKMAIAQAEFNRMRDLYHGFK